MKRVVVGCQHCIGRNDNKDEVLQEMFFANPNMELLEPYKGRTKRVKMRCKKHNVILKKSPAEVIKGHGCVQCGLEKLSEQAKLSESVFVDRLKHKYKTIHLVSNYTAITEYADFHCDICNADWTDIADYVMRRGCPRCNGTSTEMLVGEILQKYGLSYIPQFSFNDCKDKRTLPFDYYIKDYNILIEYDGEQHFKPVNFGGVSNEEAEKNFKITQYHDNIKTKYCHDHNIPLIRISYLEKKNLEESLVKKLKQYVSI